MLQVLKLQASCACPYSPYLQGALILKILRGKYPPVAGYSPDLIDIVKRCLTQVSQWMISWLPTWPD